MAGRSADKHPPFPVGKPLVDYPVHACMGVWAKGYTERASSCLRELGFVCAVEIVGREITFQIAVVLVREFSIREASEEVAQKERPVRELIALYRHSTIENGFIALPQQ
ncbi:hypothetical protein [Mesorhizobium sp. L103C105A0]|uniref:hypothetical protein n=1 Tax=Mesorhizobium sp. L103C105A0 TaxID=1287074 RepID=UPI001FD9EF6E|nr:hypothetical protein [Mesorhizobium sp. L103C105A0]